MVPQSVHSNTTFDEYAVIDLGSNSFHMVVADMLMVRFRSLAASSNKYVWQQV